ncbi:apolipoprotein N-acyltransferase [Mycetocola reblochoni]|uniref:Apolipoprotein N-acyltransferase n=1 Tax=Mycetocola reblochoni TaxID=331618 RepID=A0A3L6ZPW8_9MICO|nr:apolipoprotein N-acyltransferase [Mycetocola reblochoni]
MVPVWAAVVLAVGYGPLTDLAFPDADLWPLIVPGIAVLLVALRGRGFWGGMGLGTLAGASFYLIHIQWATLFLGVVPWAALSILEALFVGVGSGLIALAYRVVPRHWPGSAGRMLLLPAIVAGLWIARESVSGAWPYGGFAWGRVALSQSESPLAPLVAWVGLDGLGFLLVFLTAALVEAAVGGARLTVGAPFPATRVPRVPFPDRPADAVEPVRSRSTPGRLWRVLVPAITVVALTAWPAWNVAEAGSLRVGAVQGNGPAGYFDRAEQGEVRDAQFEATLPLIGEDLDLVVWPEASAELDPRRDATTEAMLGYLSSSIGAPLLVGAITERDGELFNSSLLVESDDEGTGVSAQYDKHRPVPFGEYVPDRAFWEPFAPELIGLIQREYTPGTGSAALRIGQLTAAVSICFDIVDDALTRDAVRDGASVIIAQTNNADFGETDENQQQLAIARMRAIETGRSLLNLSTVGTSQAIGPDGTTIAALPAYTATQMAVDLPLSRSTTPAIVIGPAVSTLVTVGGLSALAAAVVVAARRRGDVLRGDRPPAVGGGAA